jgi:gliding motility-associatede transport system auxiliary component
MKKLLDLSSPLGVLILIGSTAWTRAGKTLPGEASYWLYAGLFLILLHVALRFEDITKSIGRRQMKYGANSLVLVLVVLGILGAVNYLTFRNTKKWDLTKGQRYSLAEPTKKLLGSLTEDVKIIYFQRAANVGEGDDRLKEYAAASPRIKTQFIDPVADPARARDYDITTMPTLVLERGLRREKIQNDSEQDITNALVKITRDSQKTVCFVSGEGERDIDDSADGGFSGAKSALAKSQYQTKKFVLLQEGKVPEGCSVVVVPGPQKDLLPPAINVLREYVKGGGKLLVLIEPELKESFPNLQALLAEWNLETAKDVVLDVSLQSQLSGTGPLTPLAAQYPYHEITRDFRLATAFHTARSVKAGSATTPGLHAQNLVETSEASWAESDLSLKDPVQLDAGKDQKGPVSLGAVATLEVGAGAPPPAPSPAPDPGAPPEKKPEARVVAYGDSDWATNAFLGFPGNQDLFVNSVAWLAQDVDLISIRAREPDDQRLFLTKEQQQNVFVLSLLFIPGAFVILGILAWWRRR